MKDNILGRLVPFLLVATVCLAFAVGILWEKVRKLESPTASPVPKPQVEQVLGQGKLADELAEKITQVNDQDHIQGSRDAKVFLIEYSDPECPYCKKFHLTAQQLVDEYKGQVAWVYRHFPLDMLHTKARAEAEAMECAGELGGEEAFWTFNDKLYEITPSNNGLDLDKLPQLASQIGLDVGKFKECLAAKRYKDKVEDNYQGGSAAGVTGTPGNFVINSQGDAWFVPGAVSLELLKKTIDQALQD